jgi:hypothetical protein
MGTNTIDHTTLTHLVEAGAVCGTDVVGLGSGWGIIVKYGMTERALATRRGAAVRTFRKFETLVSYLKNVGISKYNVDASNYDPTRIDAARRPDRSAALKRTHEEAAYNAWFREQIQASIDDHSPAVSHEDAKAQFADRKATLRKVILETS